MRIRELFKITSFKIIAIKIAAFKITAIIIFLLFVSDAKSAEPLAAYCVDSLWYFIDDEGNLLFPPRSDVASVEGSSEGYIRVKFLKGKDTVLGFMNSRGDKLEMPGFNFVDNFHEGKAIVGISSDSSRSGAFYGFIDEIGSLVIPIKFEDVTSFSEGMAYIMNRRVRGFIDKFGKVTIPLDSLTGYNFSDGMAAVSNSKYIGGYINKEGKLKIKMQYEVYMPFSEGLAVVSGKNLLQYIDTNGTAVTEDIFRLARPFKQGRAFVAKPAKGFSVIWALIDKQGMQVTDFKFTECMDFNDGLAAVSIDSLWGFINLAGKIVIEPKFARVGSFSAGLAWAANPVTGEYGFIDKTGEFVISLPKFNKVYDLRLSLQLY